MYDVTNYKDLDNLEFYTKRDIKSNFALSIIRMNAWKISPFLSKDAENDPMLVEVRYVIPNNVDENSLIFLPNGYANIGRYEDTTIPLREGFKDITNDVISTLHEGQMGIKLYTHRVQPGTNTYERNITGTRKISGFSKIPLSQKRSIDFLKKGVYFTIVENGSPKDNIYRIMDVIDDNIIVHLNKINNDGEIITIEKRFNKDTLLQNSVEKNNRIEIPNGAIFNLFLQNNNKKMDVLIQAAKENASVESLQNTSGVLDLLDRMKMIFGDYGIDVEIDNSNNEFSDGQFAKIKTEQVGDSLKTIILLDGKKGTKYDLIHENLHIFLTALRLSDYSAYEQAIEAVLGENIDENLLDREERFVKKLITYVKNGFSVDFLDNSGVEVMKQLYNIVKSINPNFNLDLSSAINNPLSLLTSSIKDVFGYKEDISSKYYDMRLIDSETAFRAWAQNNNVMIKCN